MKNRSFSTESLKQNRGALKIAGIYLLIGWLWILFSDRFAAGIATDQAMLTTISIYKGWGYVFVTAFLLYWLIRRHTDSLRRNEEQLQLVATRHRETEDERREWADAFEGCAHGIALVDPDTFRITACNPAFAGMHKCRVEDVIGTAVLSIYASADHEIVRRNFEKADQIGMTQFEAQMIRKDASTFPVQMDVVSVRGENGMILYRVASAQDITERKRAEEELRERERQLTLAISSARMSIWEWDPQTNKITPALEFIEAIRLKADELQQETEPFRGLLHADDAARVLESVKEALARQSMFAEEFRILRPDGGVRWISSLSHPEYDLDRNIYKFLGTVQDVTERKQAEEQLRESEARYRALFEQTHDAVFIMDLQGNHIAANKQASVLLGYTPDELLKLSVRETSADVQESEKAMERLLRGEHLPLYERRFRRKDGELIVAEVNVELVRDEHGNPLHIQSLVRDITKRRRAEVERQALLEIMQGLAHTKDLQEFLRLIHHSIGKVIYAENFLVVAYDRESGLFEEVYTVDQYDPPSPPSALEKSLTSYIFRTGESVFITRALFDELVARGEVELVGTNSASWLGAPLKTPKGTIGVIAVQDYETPNRYSARDREFLESISSQVASAIERKWAEEKLRHSEERYRVLFEDSPVSIWEEDFSQVKSYLEKLKGDGIADLDAYFSANPQAIAECMRLIKVTDVNQAGLQLFETDSKASLLGELQKTFPVESFMSFKNELLAVSNGATSFQTESTVHTLRGNARTVTVRWAVVPGHEQDYSQVLVSLTDITKRKEAEEALRAGEEKYRLLFENNPLPMWIYDLETLRFLKVNDAAVRHYGYSADEFTSMTIKDIRPSEDVPKLLENVARVTAGIDEAGIWRHRKKDGTFIQVEILSHFVELEGRRAELVLANDVTERNRAERKLLESERRYRALFEDMPIAIWEEDFSEVKKYLDSLRERGIADYDEYFKSHPDALVECANKIRILDVNNAALQLFAAESKEQLIRQTEQGLSQGKLDHMIEFFSALARGETAQNWEGADETLAGEPIEIDLSWSVVPGYDADYSRVIITTLNVSERKQAEEAMREAEAKYRNLVERLPVIVYTAEVGINGRWTYVSPQIESLLGFTPEEWMAEPGLWYRQIHAEDRDRQNLLEQQAVVHGGSFDSEYRAFTKDGREIWIRDVGHVLPVQDGGAPIVQGTLMDVTERRQAEEKLRQSEDRYRALFEDSPVLIWEEDFSEVKKYLNALKKQGITDLRAYFESHPEALEECAALIKILDVNKAALQLFKAESKRQLIEHTSQVLIQGELSHNLEDFIAIADGRTSSGWEGEDRTLTGEPIEISLQWSVAPGHEQDYSSVIVTIMDITERKQAELELRESEERFRQLAENIQEVFWITDTISGGEIYVSPASERIWGRPVERMMNAPNAFIETVLPEDRDMVLSEIERQRKGESVELEYRITRPDGSVRWIWDRAFPIFDNSGRVTRVAGIAADITERKELELERTLLSSAIAASLNEIYLFEADTLRFAFVNDGALRNLGYTLDEALQLTPLDLKPEFDLKSFQEILSPLLLHEKPMQVFETVHRRADGSLYPVEVHLQLFERGDRRVFLAVIQDITERKGAEQALRESEEKLQSIIKHSSSMFYTHTTDHVLLYISPQSRELLDCEPEEARVHWQEFLSDNPANRQGIEATERAIQTGERQPPYELELVTRKGRKIWVQVDESPVVRDGKTVAIVGSISDITERKQAEENLRESEERFRSLFDRMQDGVYRSTHAGRFVEVNPAMVRMFGYSSREEMLEVDIKHELYFDPSERGSHVLDTGQEEVEIYRMRRKDGSEIWVEDRGSYVHDEQGNILYHEGILRDVTERVRVERETARHLTELEALYENGLAIGHLLEPRQIGERIIETFTRYLSWHHVAIRLRKENSNELELVAFNFPGLKEEQREEMERLFKSKVSTVEHGMSGLVIRNEKPIRTGNVHEYPQYVHTHTGIQSGLYMPLRIGERVIGVISVESEQPDAFTEQDERLLATLANQAAIAFENARLYQDVQRELSERKRVERELRESQQRYQDLFENSPIAAWLEDFSGMSAWLGELRARGVVNLGEYLASHPEELKKGIGLIRILNVNQAAVTMNGAHSKEELLERVHDLLLEESSQQVMIHEMEMIWNGFSSFGFEMSSRKLDGSIITGIQRFFIPTKDGKPDFERVILTSTDITERVNMEKALRDSETHYRELADSITDVFFELDRDLCFTYWNKASVELTGVEAKDAAGKTIYEIFGESEEQTRIGKIYEDVLGSRQPKTFETLISVNNEQRSFEITAHPSTRGVSVVAKDITERKRSEIIMQKRFELMEFAAHHSLEEIMQKTMDDVGELTGSPIGFFHFMEADQTTPGLQTWSSNALRLFSVPASEGRHLPVDQAGVWADAIRQRRPIVHNDYESLPNRKNLPEGHARIVREMVIPIIRSEKILAVMGIGNKPQEYTRQDLEIAERFADFAWDITERKQMEMALAEERNMLARRVEERTSALSRANANLARALRVKDEFLANMSHELRTPLNAILGLSESLAEQIAGPLNEKQLKYISTISESGHHLLALINDILDLAKIEAGQITLDINKVDVEAVCQTSLRMIKQLAQKKHQEVSLEIMEGMGLMWADERRLKQMMVNLLSNAVKFTPEGGRIGLEVRGNQDENKVTITVWDTGIGIREEDLTQLFRPFVQLDSGLAREATGTGLGLALVAQMARLHGGSVTVESQPGKGSRFTIMLPWEPALAVDTIERMKITGKFRAVKPGEHKPTILLIEDTQEVIMMLKDYLEMNGYKIVTAQDGIEGIAEAKRTRPDLILMDIQMPRMNGFEATEKLRSDPQFAHTPIIAITALAMSNDRERCLAAGMDEYISKPVNLKALVSIIQDCLSIKEEPKSP